LTENPSVTNQKHHYDGEKFLCRLDEDQVQIALSVVKIDVENACQFQENETDGK
jgi:hypothetical protein